jgi:hypothetical protein
MAENKIQDNTDDNNEGHIIIFLSLFVRWS